MKALCTFALLLLLSTSANAGIEKDKVQHVIAGLAITSVTYIFTDATVKQSVTVGVLAGLAKEVYDMRTTGFDVLDLAVTGVGALGAGFGMQFLNFKYKWEF